MELHLVIFHPEEVKMKEEDFTLEEKVEGEEGEGKVDEGVAGEICQLCDQPLTPPISLADHLLAEHDVSITLSFSIFFIFLFSLFPLFSSSFSLFSLFFSLFHFSPSTTEPSGPFLF